MKRIFVKYKPQWIFAFITLIYILSRWITFKGFNGTDDLHYAMLSADMLRGKYDPFAVNDIFAGRILLIAFQSVMLAGIIILLLWKKILKEQKQERIILKSILIGSTVFASMFFKENALIFIPFLLCITFLNKKNNSLKAGLISILTFCLLVFLSGCLYYYFTNDFFFRVKQIQTADYPNPCNYNTIQGNELLARLTYGVWTDFIVESFYPVILASVMILLRMIFDKNYNIRNDQWVIYFIILVILGLYFPFSFSSYQPLCFKARHFLFLLPLGVTISTSFLEDAWKNKRVLWLFIITSAILLAVCVVTTGEKWYWMMYGFLFLYFTLQKILAQNTLLYKLRYIMFAATLWIYMPYHLFFINSNWFKDIQSLAKKLDGNFFYFPEHDNMMHWELLHGFNGNFHSYNLEKEPFKVFVPYYEKLDTVSFNTGWFIVNKVYTERSANFLNKIDSLQQIHYFSKQISIGDMSAFFISNPSQLSYVKTIIVSDIKVFR